MTGQSEIRSNGKFAVFDIDGTIFRSGLYREVIHELIARHQVPSDFKASLNEYEVAWKTRISPGAYLDYQNALVEHFEKVLPQISVHNFQQAAEAVVKLQSGNVYAFTRQFIRQLKDQRYILIAVSGSHEELVQPFAAVYGFNFWIGQYYGRENGRFNGQIMRTHEQKEVLLDRIVRKNNLTRNNSIGIGDTRGDISLLQHVEHAIAFNPDDKLYAAAEQRGWPIVIERKNMVFHLAKKQESYQIVQASTIDHFNFDLFSDLGPET